MHKSQKETKIYKRIFTKKSKGSRSKSTNNSKPNKAKNSLLLILLYYTTCVPLHWILLSNIKNDAIEQLIGCATKSLSIHELIKVA